MIHNSLSCITRASPFVMIKGIEQEGHAEVRVPLCPPPTLSLKEYGSKIWVYTDAMVTLHWSVSGIYTLSGTGLPSLGSVASSYILFGTVGIDFHNNDPQCELTSVPDRHIGTSDGVPVPTHRLVL